MFTLVICSVTGYSVTTFNGPDAAYLSIYSWERQIKFTHVLCGVLYNELGEVIAQSEMRKV